MEEKNNNNEKGKYDKNEDFMFGKVNKNEKEKFK